MTTKTQDIIEQSQLGKSSEYKTQYDSSLLYGVPRTLNRNSIGLTDPNNLPFKGCDIWHGYELSWLNPKGKPIVALAKFEFDYASINIVESKSFKLYLNSFNQTPFASAEQVKQVLTNDLSQCAQGEVNVTLYTPNELSHFTPKALPGICLDDADIHIDNYQFDPQLLQLAHSDTGDEHQKQTFHSHLLKSNCLITNQPDWASVVIDYQGPALDQQALLRYLISFRQHNEFHEQCVERLYNDIWQLAKPSHLQVVAYYTRRGGLDISPYRSSSDKKLDFTRTNRQ